MSFKLAEAYVQIGALTGPLDKALSSIKGKVAGLASMRFNIPGGGLMAALGLGAGAVGISKAVMGASDLAETISKVQATFGGASKTVTDFADNMAQKFGLVKSPLMDAVSGIGLIAKGAGLSQSKAADMGVALGKLAADASSFYNVPMGVALEKIRAGLVGESEPLRAFGVMLSEDAVKLEAVRMGLVSSSKQLTESQKVMARSSLITKGLATASGDLERTQGGFANQLRQMQGNIQNFAVSIGEQLLPAANKLVSLFNEMAAGGTSAFTNLSTAFGGFSINFTETIETLGIVYRNWGDIVERTGVMIGGWLTNVGEVAVYLKDVFVDAFSAIMHAGSKLGDNLGSLITEVYNYVTSGFKDPIEIKFEPLLEGFESKAQLKLSSVTDQLEAIDARMVQRAAARSAAEAGKSAAKSAANVTGDGSATPNRYKAEFLSGGQDYSNKIQAAALGSKVAPTEAEKKQIDLAAKHLEEAKTLNKTMAEVSKGLKAKPGAAFG